MEVGGQWEGTEKVNVGGQSGWAVGWHDLAWVGSQKNAHPVPTHCPPVWEPLLKVAYTASTTKGFQLGTDSCTTRLG